MDPPIRAEISDPRHFSALDPPVQAEIRNPRHFSALDPSVQAEISDPRHFSALDPPVQAENGKGLSPVIVDDLRDRPFFVVQQFSERISLAAAIASADFPSASVSPWLRR
ncbi:hypothetical protein ACTHPH_00470 [Paenibacillus pasadenensis]|nr:hypothetical protein [Paenibacillus pasadenensis]